MFSRESPKLCPVGRGKINTDLPDEAGSRGHDKPTELRNPRLGRAALMAALWAAAPAVPGGHKGSPLVMHFLQF